MTVLVSYLGLVRENHMTLLTHILFTLEDIFRYGFLDVHLQPTLLKLCGGMVTALNLLSKGCRFKSWPSHCDVTTLHKFFIHTDALQREMMLWFFIRFLVIRKLVRLALKEYQSIIYLLWAVQKKQVNAQYSVEQDTKAWSTYGCPKLSLIIKTQKNHQNVNNATVRRPMVT